MVRSALLHADVHSPPRALLVPIEGKIIQRFVRARHAVEVVVDVVPVALGVLPPPQREVGVLPEQRAIQHTLLVNLGPEQEDLHAAGHDAGVDVLLEVVVAKRTAEPVVDPLLVVCVRLVKQELVLCVPAELGNVEARDVVPRNPSEIYF